MVFCSGCLRTFAPKGYSIHIAKSRNPACNGQLDLESALQEPAKDWDAQMDLDLDDPMPPDPHLNEDAAELPDYQPMYEDNENSPEHDTTRPFVGDFYGSQSEYRPEDLPGWGDQNDWDGFEDEDLPAPQLSFSSAADLSGSASASESDDEDEDLNGVRIEREHQEVNPASDPEPSARVAQHALSEPTASTPALLTGGGAASMPPAAMDEQSSSAKHLQQTRMQTALRRTVHVDQYPTGTGAGQPIPAPQTSTGAQTVSDSSSSPSTASSNGYSQYASCLAGSAENPYAPFGSQMEWDIVRWSKLRGPGSNACTELLGIQGLQEKLGLSVKNAREIDQIVDALPAPRPRFQREEVEVDGETFEVYFRDVIECIRALYTEPEFSPYLVFLPERHYSDPDRTRRLFHDMHTSKWWWAAQKAVETNTPGATIIPIIISSDKTQLTLFRNKAAYPVYLTIGNLPKDIRSKPSRGAHVLLGYLPTTKLGHITNKSARRRALANLFHACMRRILAPLEESGRTGIPMTSADGVTRRTHPLYAAYVSDYPEQVLVTCTKSGDCPICLQGRHRLGDFGTAYPYRDLSEALHVLGQVDDLSQAEYAAACKSIHLKPTYRPFWENLPYSNVFTSITPDILHQLLQGIVKHLVSWIKDAYSEEEIDARCARFPPNHNVRVFFKGITGLSRLTGREHADICRIILGLVVGMKLPDNASPVRLVRAVRAILDFVYLAQYPVHSTETLDLLDDALARFHANKAIFQELGIRSDFHFPKLHFLRHYRFLIELLGAADNYNTEYTERLHIDMAKDAYRASNKKDEYDQMTLWLERREKIIRHERYIKWRLSGQHEAQSNVNGPLHRHHESHILMTREPSAKAVTFYSLSVDYGAHHFEKAVARWISRFNNPAATPREVTNIAENLVLGFNRVPVYHKAKFWESDFPRYRHASDEYDIVHAKPHRFDKRQRLIPGRFDTALVNLGDGGAVGVDGYRVARVRAIFSFPKRCVSILFPHRLPPDYLAYVEWFTPFTSPNDDHRLFKIAHARSGGTVYEHEGVLRSVAIIPLTDIRRSIHLYPCFGEKVPRDWTSDNVLDRCSKFHVSCFTDRHAYGVVI